MRYLFVSRSGATVEIPVCWILASWKSREISALYRPCAKKFNKSSCRGYNYDYYDASSVNSEVSMKLLTVAAMAFTLLAGSVNAAEQLNAYSIMPEKYASKVFAEFTKDTGIKVNFMRFSSGEALARLNA